MSRGQGQWNAYCEAAPNHEEYLARLDQVPAYLREGVIRHCQCAAALSARAAERQIQEQRRRARLGLADG